MSEIGRGWGVKFRVEPMESTPVPGIMVPAPGGGWMLKAVEQLAGIMEGSTPGQELRFSEPGTLVLPPTDEALEAEIREAASDPNLYQSQMYGPGSYGVLDLQSQPISEVQPRTNRGLSMTQVTDVADMGQYGFVSLKVAYAPVKPYVAKADGVYSMSIQPQQAYDLAYEDEAEEDEPVWTDV